MRIFLKKLINKVGYDVQHLPTNPIERKQLELLKSNVINLILDIGANTGQFGRKIRDLGYEGRIVSFEPQSVAFDQLQKNSLSDKLWEVENFGLGKEDSLKTINVSKNSYSSSILPMMEQHLTSAPDAVYVDKEEIEVKRLDNIFHKYVKNSDSVFVKIDTQGFEKQVLIGAEGVLDNIKGFQMELSLTELYQGETLMQDMISFLKEKGFLLRLIEGGHQNYNTGELLQVEAFFYK